MLAVISLLDEVVIASEVVLGGDAGEDRGDDMALTDTKSLRRCQRPAQGLTGCAIERRPWPVEAVFTNCSFLTT
jgi:hypothetical protein